MHDIILKQFSKLKKVSHNGAEDSNTQNLPFFPIHGSLNSNDTNF